MKKNHKNYAAFTLTELIVSVAIGFIVILAIGFTLADSSRGFKQVYDSANKPVVAGAYGAQRAFDRIVRRCSDKLPPVLVSESVLDVYYTSDSNYTAIDRQVRFSVNGDSELTATTVSYPGSQQVSQQVICSNVSSCVFKKNGRSAQMILVLDDGSKVITSVGSAYLHN